MRKFDKEDFRKWLESRPVEDARDWLSKETGISLSTINKYLAPKGKIQQSAEHHFSLLMEMDTLKTNPRFDADNVVLPLDVICELDKMREKNGYKSLHQFIIDRLNAITREDLAD